MQAFAIPKRHYETTMHFTAKLQTLYIPDLLKHPRARMSDIEDENPVICIDEATLIQLTKKLEQNLLALQENIKELKRHVTTACGRKRYGKPMENPDSKH